MGLNDPSKKQPRQDPVSCELCRKKKLRCDRSTPCSNCESRKTTCSYGSYGPGAVKTVVRSRSQTQNRPPDPRIVSPRRQGPAEHTGFETLNQPTEDPLATADWLETIMMGHRVSSAVPAPLRDELSRHPRVDSPRPHQTTISGNLLTLLRDGRTASAENPATIHLPSFLPTETEAMGLLQYYNNHLDYQYHLIIPERTKRDIHMLYEKIARSEPVNQGHLALLFSIVATALFFQLLSTDSAEFAEICSRETAFLAGAALIQSNHISYPSVAGLQAAMIIAHHLSSHTLNTSVSSLFVHGALVSQAKALGLHILDCPRIANERNSKEYDKVGLELKRRLWWDLASYDW